MQSVQMLSFTAFVGCNICVAFIEIEIPLFISDMVNPLLTVTIVHIITVNYSKAKLTRLHVQNV